MPPSPRVAMAALALLLALPLQAAEPRALPAGTKPNDARLAPLKELDGYFPFQPPVTMEEWLTRRAQVKRQIQVSLGLWPLPDFGDYKPQTQVTTVYQDDEYTVQAVTLETMPGHFVTGNLYLPKPGSYGQERFPAVLSPHGHWPGGRFMDAKPEEVSRQLSSGAEKFTNAARSPLQARCVHLARMGFVVFHYDMLGYADSTQIPYAIAHGFKTTRPELTGASGWGFFSPRAEALGQNIMGLQVYNGLKALDFLSTHPDVNPNAIGVTGASGGATQTMMLCALDDRIAAAFPAVMVSTAMQGGCTCENASCLRVGTGNVEFASLFAPKPMAMTAADDWTHEMATKGFPQMQQLWRLFGAQYAENVQLTALTQFKHNFNAPSRAAMYAWFRRHLQKAQPAEVPPERDFTFLTRGQLTRQDFAAIPPSAQAPDQPAQSVEEANQLPATSEADLLRRWQQATVLPIIYPRRLREFAPSALEVLIGRTAHAVQKPTWEVKEKQEREQWFTIAGLIRNEFDEELPALGLHPKAWKGHTVVWLEERGKAGLLQPGSSEPRAEVRRLLEAGVSVLGVDLLYQGEFLTPGEQFTQTRRSTNPREVPAYTFGYNLSVFAQRVQDLLTVRALARQDTKHPVRTLSLVAPGRMGPIAAAARAMLGREVTAALLGGSDFRFADLQTVQDPMFLPGIARYGDLPGLLALGAPHPTRLLATQEAPALARAAYLQEATPDALTTQETADFAAALDWLLKQLPK